MIRVAAYIDGYNLYHAIDRTNQPHLKWLDLWALCDRFVPNLSARLTAVHYFSAYATWLPKQANRHRAYVAALEATGVISHMARFKEKDRRCPLSSCGHRWKGHEEKETDVHLALALLDHAYKDQYDRALIVSRDSDLVPAARMVRSAFPSKEVFSVAPPGSGHSNDMLKVCDGKKHTIRRKHLAACLLPDRIPLPDGNEIVRPSRYDPPVPLVVAA